MGAVILVALVWACAKKEEVIPKSTEKAISAFAFGSLSPVVTGSISGNSITATVPFGTDLKLAPSITTSLKATVSPASGTVQDFSKAVTYTVTAEDATTQSYTVTVSVGAAPKSSAKDITKFSFAALSPAIDATIDATAKTISATVPAATDVTKLVPTIATSAKATVSPATGAAQDFSKEVSYTVTAEDASTVVYKVNVKKEAVVPTVSQNDVIFVGSWDKKLYAIDANTGTKKWEFLTGNTISASPAYANGVVYVGSWDKKFYAIDANTGTKKWEFVGTSDFNRAPTLANNTVFVSSGTSLFAIDAVNGTKKWEVSLGITSFSLTNPVVVNDIVYVLSNDIVYALNATDGTTKWKSETGQFSPSYYSDNSIAVVDGVVFAPNNKAITAIDVVTGVKKWEYTTKYSISSPTVANGAVYLIDGGGAYLYSIDIATGKLNWRTSGQSNTGSTSPIAAKSFIFQNITQSNDPATGNVKWSISDATYGNSSLTYANDILYGAGGKGGTSVYNTLYAVDALTGKRKWEFNVGGEIRSSPCVLAKDGKVYYGGETGMQQ